MNATASFYDLAAEKVPKELKKVAKDRPKDLEIPAESETGQKFLSAVKA